MELEVIDNFLPSSQFDLIQSFFMGDKVAWYMKEVLYLRVNLEMIINSIPAYAMAHKHLPIIV